jgi:Ca2+-binding RTX toxin-like protein
VTGERNLVVGGEGSDTLAFDNGVEPGTLIDLAAGQVARGDGVLIAGVSGIEAVRVTGGARVVGDGEANILVGTGTGPEDRPFAFFGGGGDDLLAVRSAAVGARLDGGEGDDTLDGSLGADTFIGREGRDTVTYADAQAGVVVDLADGSLNAGEAAGDRFSQIENLLGSGFGDRLSANGGTNLLDGGAGDDRLQGHGGADTLLGGDGADTLEGGERSDGLEGGAGDDVLVGGEGRDGLTGGAGADVFVFEDLLDGGDRIFDFVSGEDRIRLDASAFGVADPAAVAFLDEAPAEGDGPVLVYAEDGALSFDGDGAGAGEAVLLATLQGRPPLIAADIVWA